VKLVVLFLTFLLTQNLWARSYVIFSMNQELNMGVEEKPLRKNYFVNMGSNQGVKKDTVLDVFRIISVQNPYDNKKRVNYKVKIGELKVITSSDEAAIAYLSTYLPKEETPIFDLEQFMVGDHVAIRVN
jgi:DNA-binding GntR family transcriptional regulator